MSHEPAPVGGDMVVPALPDLAPPHAYDPVLEIYKRDVDRTLLRENLKLSVEKRLEKFVAFMRCLEEVREAGRRMRGAQFTQS